MNTSQKLRVVASKLISWTIVTMVIVTTNIAPCNAQSSEAAKVEKELLAEIAELKKGLPAEAVKDVMFVDNVEYKSGKLSMYFTMTDKGAGILKALKNSSAEELKKLAQKSMCTDEAFGDFSRGLSTIGGRLEIIYRYKEDKVVITLTTDELLEALKESQERAATGNVSEAESGIEKEEIANNLIEQDPETIETTIKQAMVYANNMCPVVLVKDLLTMDSVVYRNHEAFYYYTFSEHGANNFAAIKRINKEDFKNALTLELRQNTAVRKTSWMLGKIGGAYHCIYRYGGEQVECTLTTKELLSLGEGPTDATTNRNKKFEERAKLEAKQCPIEIEKGLTMVDCTFDGDNLNFIIECSQDKFEAVRENATSVKGSTALKLNIDRTMTTFVADCKKFKVDIAYLFIEKKSDRMIRFIYDTETGKFE